jgi:hypothetical protein
METAAFSLHRRILRGAGIACLALFAGCVVYPNGTVGPLFPPPSVVITAGTPYQTYYQPYGYRYGYGYRPYWGYRGYYPYRYWGGGYYRGGYYRGGYWGGRYWR